MGFGAEVITLRQDKCIRYFKNKNATSLSTAVSVADISLSGHLHKRTMRHLINEGVIIEKAGMVYLDEDRWEVFRKSLKRWFLA